MPFNRQFSISIFIAFLILSFSSSAQTNKAKWYFLLDGYLDVIIKDIAVDTSGNTYLAVDYSGNLTVPVLKLVNRFGRMP